MSLLTQRTLSPALIVSAAGLNAVPSIVTVWVTGLRPRCAATVAAQQANSDERTALHKAAC